MEDYKNPKKIKPADIKMSAELPDEVDSSLELSEPKKKIYKKAKAQVIETRKKNQGELF